MPAQGGQAEMQLESFIERYPPEIGALARAALAKLRKRLPGAVQLVYDNYNALVVGFGPSQRASEAILSIALYTKWINLFFLHGADLPDPEKLLKGGGKQVRSIRLGSASDLDQPAVRLPPRVHFRPHGQKPSRQWAAAPVPGRMREP